MALLLGFTLVCILGIAHHYGLLAIRAAKPNAREAEKTAIMIVFVGLVALHTLQILAFAFVYRLIVSWSGMGGLSGQFGGSWNDLIYYSGINFVTLGYTQIEAAGPLRIVSMMQSLGGFMVLTWSATFLYSVCDRAWSARD
ncbi:ion channel [Paracoccus sp. T5]|uniref:ion channel n=1 Tax=Paracoccus sp. T5 TaxID=3402161 RepID=UPI003ADFEB28